MLYGQIADFHSNKSHEGWASEHVSTHGAGTETRPSPAKVFVSPTGIQDSLPSKSVVNHQVKNTTVKTSSHKSSSFLKLKHTATRNVLLSSKQLKFKFILNTLKEQSSPFQPGLHLYCCSRCIFPRFLFIHSSRGVMGHLLGKAINVL